LAHFILHLLFLPHPPSAPSPEREGKRMQSNLRSGALNL
jgi:hypothetical protein